MHPAEYEKVREASGFAAPAARSGDRLTPAMLGLTRAVYDVNETLRLLSIGRTSFYAMLKSGELKSAKLGKKTLIYASDICALLQRLRDDTTGQQQAA